MKEVLIIDDSDLMREELCESLAERFMFSLHTAESAQEGITKLKEKKISLVVCDFEMPGGSGLEVVQFVESNQLPVKLIVFTGLDFILGLEHRPKVEVIYNKNFLQLFAAVKRWMLEERGE